METIKSKFLDELMADFELLAEIILKELNLIEELLEHIPSPSIEEEIRKYEKIIDSLDIKIREEVISSIFLFNPKALDLRKIISYHDMTIYLERIGDLILNIARKINMSDLHMDEFITFREALKKLVPYVKEMISNAVFAFSCEDNTRAYEAIAADDNVDKLYREIRDKLQQTFAGKALSGGQLNTIMLTSNIAYNIERIGDNATNIAESAIYLVEGKDIRHKNN